MTHPTTAYAEAVVNGEIVTGRPVRWACERHLRDLETGESRGLYFDEASADRVLKFFGLLRHYEGEWGLGGGQPFVPEPWQQFKLGSIFGWVREDGTRRFRTAWVEVARKNGKSLTVAGVGLYLLVVDGEPGAQIVTAATKREQARIIHRGAVRMRDKSPELCALVEKVRDRLFVESSASFFIPLGADSKTEDGLNPHGILIDEIHAHPDGSMWDVLESGAGSRRQPLLLAATTAGFDRYGFGGQQHDYFRRVIDPSSGIENDDVFVYLAELDRDGTDEDDDPFDESVWIKANPNLGVSVKLDYLRSQARKAQQNPRELNNFLVKNLNVWTSQAVRWLPMDRWDRCVGPWEEA